MRISSSLLLIAASIVAAQDTCLKTVKKAFDAANIPTDLSIEFNPTLLLEVTLPPTGVTLHAGIQLPRNDTVGPPTFQIRSGNVKKRQFGPSTFVIAAVDPDAPTPQNPTSAQIRHFLGSNFQLGADGVLTNTTAAISGWRQPTPPAGSDAHRYIFLLFNQPAGFDSQTVVNATTPTSLFNISSFAEQTGLGNPVAGTFMLVAPDPSA